MYILPWENSMREEYKNFVVIDGLQDTKGEASWFRKKPVAIMAVRLQERVCIKTLEGDMFGEVGDWLLRGVKGELYPCKDDIFRATYDIAHDMELRGP
jgi:hypothetical protein